MLKFVFIKENQEEKLNKVLENSIIASGQPIIKVGDGVMFPYEDGVYMSKQQQIITLRDLGNKARQSAELVMVEQDVLVKQIAEIKRQIDTLTSQTSSESGKEAYDANKSINEKIKELQVVLSNKELSVTGNQAQITQYLDESKGYYNAARKIAEGDNNQGHTAENNGSANETVKKVFQAQSKDGRLIATGSTQEDADENLKKLEAKHETKKDEQK